jgi:trimeric autotransporter adhesin
VTANPQALSPAPATYPATYSGTVTIYSSAGYTQIGVTLLVTASPATCPTATVCAVLQANPPYFNFSSGNVLSQGAQLLASDGATLLNIGTITPSASWISVSSPSQTTTPASIQVTVNPAGLPTGLNYGYITINSSNAANTPPLQIPVLVTVSTATGALTFVPPSISLTSPSSLSTTLAVGTSISGTSFTVTPSTTSGGNWLSVTLTSGGSAVTSGTAPVNLLVTANASGLAAGTYSGSLAFVANGITQTVPVSLTVPSATGGNVTASPSSLTFSYQTGGTAPAAQTVTISNAVAGTAAIPLTISATTTSGGSWLTLGATSASTPYQLSVTVSPSGLSAGQYSGNIAITPTGGSVVNVPVTLTVTAPPTVSASPTTLTFNYTAGGATPAAQSISVSGGGATLAFTATASTTSGGNWLSVSPTSGNTPATLSVTIVPAGLNAGTYTGTVVVSGTSGAAGSTTVNVTLTVTAPLPTITQVVNSASDASADPVSPGEVITIAGTGLGPATPVGVTLDSNGNVSTTSGGVQVLFNGIAAPILYASATQINCIVPYQLAGILSPFVQVKYAGQTSNAITLSVVAAAPGVYTQNEQGSGPAAVYNQNGSVNSQSNPEKKGNVVEIFITGEGQTSPPGVTGMVTPITSVSQLPKPLLPVSVLIGGQPASIYFYGEVPFYQGNQLVYVSGVLQIDAIIPAATASGNVSLVVTVGNASSQSNVTLSVQ